MTKEKTNPYEVEKTRIFAGLMFIGLILFLTSDTIIFGFNGTVLNPPG